MAKSWCDYWVIRIQVVGQFILLEGLCPCLQPAFSPIPDLKRLGCSLQPILKKLILATNKRKSKSWAMNLNHSPVMLWCLTLVYYLTRFKKERRSFFSCFRLWRCVSSICQGFAGGSEGGRRPHSKVLCSLPGRAGRLHSGSVGRQGWKVIVLSLLLKGFLSSLPVFFDWKY